MTKKKASALLVKVLGDMMKEGLITISYPSGIVQLTDKGRYKPQSGQKVRG